MSTRKGNWYSKDCAWYVPNRKSPIAYSTLSTLFEIEELIKKGYDTPNKLKNMTEYYLYDEARLIVDTYIKKGYGDYVLNV